MKVEDTLCDLLREPYTAVVTSMADEIRILESIPTLGTGKVDPRAARRLAQPASVAEGV